jgi:hypothetical protein
VPGGRACAKISRKKYTYKPVLRASGASARKKNLLYDCTEMNIQSISRQRRWRTPTTTTTARPQRNGIAAKSQRHTTRLSTSKRMLSPRVVVLFFHFGAPCHKKLHQKQLLRATRTREPKNAFIVRPGAHGTPYYHSR